MRLSTSRLFGTVGLVLALGLAGCSSGADQAGESLVEDVVESTAGEAADSGGELETGSPISSDTESPIGEEIETDGEGGLSITGDDGSVQIGSFAEIPADFPAGHPFPGSGTLTSAWKSDASWQLIYQATVHSEYKSLLDHYTSSGYQEVLRTEAANINDHQMALYESDQWGVALTWEDVEGGTLTYTVSGR